jgi:hypothetical protein
VAPPASPTIVWASFTYNRVGALDPVSGTYDLDGYLSLSWADARTDAALLGQCEGAAQGSGEPAFFVPWVELVNEEVQLINTPPRWFCFEGAPPFAGAPAVASAYNFSAFGLATPSPGLAPAAAAAVAAAAAAQLPWITLYARIAGTFFAPFQLGDFPFDRQVVPLSLESRDWPSDVLRYRSAPGGLDAVLPPGLAVPGFTLVTSASSEALRFYPAFSASYSHFTVNVTVLRNSQYYLYKAVSNVVLLVLMSLLAALLRPNDANRAVIQLTTFMGIVSWVFVLSNDSPRSQSTTRMDAFMLTSFGAIFVLYLYYSVTFALKEKESKVKERARTASVHATIAAARRPTPSVVGAIHSAFFGPARPGALGHGAGLHVGAGTGTAPGSAGPPLALVGSATGLSLPEGEDEDDGAAKDGFVDIDAAGAGAGGPAAARPSLRSQFVLAGVPAGACAGPASPQHAFVNNPLHNRRARAPDAAAGATPAGRGRRSSGSSSHSVASAGSAASSRDLGADDDRGGGGALACCGPLAGRDDGGLCRGCACLPARLKSSIRLRDLGVTILVLIVYITLVSVVLQPPAT